VVLIVPQSQRGQTTVATMYATGPASESAETGIDHTLQRGNLPDVHSTQPQF